MTKLHIIRIFCLSNSVFKGLLSQMSIDGPVWLVIECLTRIPAVLDSSSTWSSRFFVGVSLVQDTSEPQPSTGETQETHA